VRQPTNGRKGKTFGGICMSIRVKICYLETRGGNRSTPRRLWDNNQSSYLPNQALTYLLTYLLNYLLILRSAS
jgi:hypothetical protein